MGIWATASLLLAGLLAVQTRPQQQYGFFYLPPEAQQSALNLYNPSASLTRAPRYNNGLLENFDEHFARMIDGKPQTFETAEERNGNDVARVNGYDDYKTSQTTHYLGPHNVETINSDHFHKKVPSLDISEFHHQQEKHGEVHYHQHKHVHNHEHKQEHVHDHKNDHQHKHLHHQQHKHEHHQQHKHGHEHKHDHHQEHKHDHHHDHKQDHHHEHKEDHHHGHQHKHQHQQQHKHQHGHKHEAKHNHHHGHKHYKH